MNYNQRTVTLRLKRIEVIDILLALSTVSDNFSDADKWMNIHDQIGEQLQAFDEKYWRGEDL